MKENEEEEELKAKSEQDTESDAKPARKNPKVKHFPISQLHHKTFKMITEHFIFL